MWGIVKGVGVRGLLGKYGEDRYMKGRVWYDRGNGQDQGGVGEEECKKGISHSFLDPPKKQVAVF